MAKKQSLSGSLIFMFFFLAFFAGPVMAYLGYDFVQKGEETRHWAEAPGKILSSDIKQVTEQSAGTRGGNIVTWQPDITYRYVVDGASYIGDMVTVFIVHTGSQEPAKNWVHKFPKDAEVTVYYDPADPQRSVLEAGIGDGPYIMAGLGAILTLISWGGLVLRIFSRHGNQEAA